MVSKTNMGEGIRGSKIEAAIREVEALIADREIRDRLAAHRQCKADPVVERGVYDLVAPDYRRSGGRGGCGQQFHAFRSRVRPVASFRIESAHRKVSGAGALTTPIESNDTHPAR